MATAAWAGWAAWKGWTCNSRNARIAGKRGASGAPFHLLIGYAVLESERELEAIAPMIVTYHGDEIHEWVKYQGARYDYAFVAPPRYKLRVKKNELWLAPGIVYVRNRA
jgi:hypothetical protein